jgi:hypothetical protein
MKTTRVLAAIAAGGATTVVAQRAGLSGRRQVEIRYYPSPSFGEGGGWYVLDRRYIRRLDDEG